MHGSAKVGHSLLLFKTFSTFVSSVGTIQFCQPNPWIGRCITPLTSAHKLKPTHRRGADRSERTVRDQKSLTGTRLSFRRPLVAGGDRSRRHRRHVPAHEYPPRYRVSARCRVVACGFRTRATRTRHGCIDALNNAALQCRIAGAFP
ncbi:hypothetical protein EVAR_3850_1 [Eumeta japonica]|uniref:Secreted protein n=1 Tax=Eumeta variegata TaxID=151549 RepID=A0A4C1STT4_EUMVA|nr:hypothetical protein EVAR_3850_1 [Eumeta japonica]